MAKIKTVSVQALMPSGIHKYLRWATFTTYEADNGDQWRAAVARNRRISEFIDTFKKIAEIA